MICDQSRVLVPVELELSELVALLPCFALKEPGSTVCPCLCQATGSMDGTARLWNSEPGLRKGCLWKEHIPVCIALSGQLQ